MNTKNHIHLKHRTLAAEPVIGTSWSIWTLWGHFKQVVNQLSTYFALYSMIATSMILWRVVVKPLLDEYKLDISLWWFVLALGAFTAVASLVEWKRSMPGTFRSWSLLFYAKDNPLRKDVEKLLANDDEFRKALIELTKKYKDDVS